MLPYSKSQLYFPDEDKFESQREDPRGFNPDDRPIEMYLRKGIINLDKPTGPTSHDVVATVKKILGIKKAGHAGTLDPQVTGILPIGLNDSTKVLPALLQLPKTYICNMQVKNKLRRVNWSDFLQNFVGLIYQYPPLESNVARRLRKRRIYSIQHLDELNNQILFEVTCESGTYIRTLCEDLGRAAGTVAFMKELRRTQTATFDESDRKTLHQLFDAWMDFKEFGDEKPLRDVVKPVERMVTHLKEIIVSNNAVVNVCHGTALGSKGILGYDPSIQAGEMVAAKTVKGELIGLGEATTAFQVLPESEVVFKVDRVIMDREHYK